MKLEAMRAVYCYHFPEVRPLLHEVERALPDDLYRVTAPVAEVAAGLASLFDPALELPSLQGYVDLDELHVPVIDRIVTAYADVAPALSGFSHRYPTSGSSEGLFHLLAQARSAGIEAINVLDGEYEGYGAQAGNLGMGVHVRAEGEACEPGLWFVSNPSARDGNLLSKGLVAELCEAGHRVVLDLAYAGATAPHLFDVSHPNIVAVVLSFSKPYGVFRHRIGGFAFSREPLPTLYGNKWFKDTLRLCQALKLAEELGPGRLYERYRPLQERIVRELEQSFDLGMKPSDALLISYLPPDAARSLPEPQRAMVAPYQRGAGFRFCLTPYFERAEQG